MSPEKTLPLISIAMPVYNEGKYIRETLESLLAQDYSNLEIIISDNCSTDKTAAICREFAQNDERILFHQQQENIGVGPNFIHTFELSKGNYFMWASGHDKWDADCISSCIKSLENDNDALLAFGTPVWMDEKGEILNKFSGWYDTRGMSPVARFCMVLWGSMNPVLGLFRREKIPDLRRYNYAGADLPLLAMLAIQGTFIHVTNTHLYRRQNRALEDHQERMGRYKGKEMRIAVSGFSRLFPLARLPFELLRTTLSAPTSKMNKFFITLLLLPALPIRYIIGKKASGCQ